MHGELSYRLLRLPLLGAPGGGLVRAALPALFHTKRTASALARMDPDVLCWPRFRFVREATTGPPTLLFRLLARSLTRGITGEYDRLDTIYKALKGAKGTEHMGYWPLPLEALALPRLDCKGFSMLFVMLAKGAGMDARLVVGVDVEGSAGHAWAEADTESGRMIYDPRLAAPVSFNGRPGEYGCIVSKAG
ncbi:MAG: transglutaminase domain-containing protein [Nitrospirae bacterium]|nr:transglutaminase domain-containing protein [Nitrospirota bacterium]